MDTKPGLWTLDWTLDSIIELDFRSSGVKGYSTAKLCSWCCKLEGLPISMLQNYRRWHFRWDSNLVQALCFLKTRWVLVDQNHTVHQQYGNIYAEDWCKLWREKEWDSNPGPSEY